MLFIPGDRNNRNIATLENLVNRLYQKVIIGFVICLTMLIPTMRVQAIPPLPSSIYGTVKVNGTNVPDGTMVEAVIGGQVVAVAYTQTYKGDSVYSIDIPGDDPATSVIEGGTEGASIDFNVGGVLANEEGTWHGATNVQVNLTLNSIAVLNTPQSTPTQIATQTPIILNYATDLPVMVTDDSSATPVIESPLSGSTIQPNDQENSIPANVVGVPSTAAGIPLGNQANSGTTRKGLSLDLILISVLMVILFVAIILLVIELIRQRKSKDEGS